MSDSYSPPASVRAAARRGLELRDKGGKGGLTNKEASKQGIGSGIQRARNLANGDSLSLSTVKRMKAFFDRHEKNKSIAAGKKPHEDAGYVSWLLWGGDPGRAWANKIVDQAEKVEKADKLPGGRADGMKPADFDPSEFADGKDHEMEHTSDPDIAAEIAMDHLAEHDEYYTMLEQLERAAKTGKLSLSQHKENKRKLNARPEARAARAKYNREHGKDKHIKAQYNYRNKHPERYKAQQKARSESSEGSHKCAVCGKPADHKHHTSYGKNAQWRWLCHTHHVRTHHPKSDLGKSMYVYRPKNKLSKAMAAGGQIPAASLAVGGTNYVSNADGPVAKPKKDKMAKAEGALMRFAQVLNSPEWTSMLVKTPWYAQGRTLDTDFRKGKISVDTYQDSREHIMISMMNHLKKAMPPSPEMVIAEPGQILAMDMGYGVPLMALSAVQVLSPDDLGVYSALPMGDRMKKFLQMNMVSHESGNPADYGAERSDMKKSDVFAEILGQDVGELRKAMNTVQRGESVKNIGSPGANASIPDGPSGERALFNKEPKSGMPNEKGEGGREEIWSADDTEKAKLGSKHSLVQATGDGDGSGDQVHADQKMMKKGMVHYYTGEDDYIVKSMDDQGCVRSEPTLGMPNTPLVSQHVCSNQLCKSEYSRALTVCPDCGTGMGSLAKGYRGVILDQSVARALRPEHVPDLYIGRNKG